MEISDSFLTIDNPSEGEFKDRGSKFIAILFPMKSENDFVNKMSELKSLHLKARHHCYAYRIREPFLDRSSDDGEPSGSAGKPIMNQLLSRKLVDVGCIVVRYFGGTKLGVSGLINAYKQAAHEAISLFQVRTKYVTGLIEISFSYAKMGILMDALKYL